VEAQALALTQEVAQAQVLTEAELAQVLEEAEVAQMKMYLLLEALMVDHLQKMEALELMVGPLAQVKEGQAPVEADLVLMETQVAAMEATMMIALEETLVAMEPDQEQMVTLETLPTETMATEMATTAMEMEMVEALMMAQLPVRVLEETATMEMPTWVQAQTPTATPEEATV